MRTHAHWILGVIVAFAMPTLPARSQSLGLPHPSQDARSAAKGSINNGRLVTIGGMYGNLRIDCVRCHGLDGSGNSSGAFPRLTDQSGWYLYKTLQDYASGLRPSAIMQPIANALSAQEMQDVAAYYASVKDAPYPPKLEADVQTLQHGGAIAAVGIPSQGVPACSGCHGPRGIGNGPIYPYLAGQFAPYLQDQLILWKKGNRHGDPMNIMEMIAKAMTEDQIRAVSVYYASVRPGEVTPNERREPSSQGAPEQRSHATPPPDSARGSNPQPGREAVVVPGAEPSMASPTVNPSTLSPRQPPTIVRPPYLSTPPAPESNAGPAKQ